ncbi:hypothetical protein Glove_283g35 [Diversispora epigaea]|uniref:Uncharacterized protein n=1 Tax=Diversispora epigaea TaxID=1348612 RepID=A0A397I6R0_9GLOM|nr:hypothetical protein Glove_283g35 [Diversispora epigaea]
MDLQTRADNILPNLNIHPPPAVEDVVDLNNFRKCPSKYGRQTYTGYKLLRFNVARQSKSLGEINPLIISKISDFLWANSTPNERLGSTFVITTHIRNHNTQHTTHNTHSKSQHTTHVRNHTHTYSKSRNHTHS